MTDFLANMGIVLGLITLVVGIALFTVFIVLNEYKLKKTKSPQALTKMYKDALYVSICIVFIGIIMYIAGLYTGDSGIDITFFGGNIITGGLLAVTYSSISLYNITHRKQRNE